jgi:DNA polymerase kappa
MLLGMEASRGKGGREVRSPGPAQRTVPLGVEFNEHKAGLDGRSRADINRVVEATARGGRFYANAERKERELVAKIAALRARVAAAPARSAAADALVSAVDGHRTLDQTYVCVDFDAFFSSVAELDDPSLAGKPHAVGGGVLATSSYEARKYGVRSAMPLFIAKKLCPDLVLVRPDPKRYAELSERTARLVFSKYDADYEMRGCDECMINLTGCLASSPHSVEDLVEKLRADVAAVTGGLSVSAGVASTRALAKICADMNKPDGSFHLQRTRDATVAFCAGLKLRKIPGIGKVTERILTDAFGVESVGDILRHRAALHHVLSEGMCRWLIASALGVCLPSHDEDHGADAVRKSVSRERTFGPLREAAKLREITVDLCRRVAQDLARLDGIDGGKTVTLKIKRSDFSVFSRSKTIATHVADAAGLERVVMPALERELPLEVRLLGLRVSGLVGPLVSAKRCAGEPLQGRIDSFFGSSGAKRHADVAGVGGEPARVAAEFGDNSDGDWIPPRPLSQPSAAGGLGDWEELVCPVCDDASFTRLTLLHRHLDECLSVSAGLVSAAGVGSTLEGAGRAGKRRRAHGAVDAAAR